MSEVRDAEHFEELCAALTERYIRVRFERTEHVHM